MKKCQALILLSVILCCKCEKSQSKGPATELEKNTFFEWKQNFSKVYTSKTLQDEAMKSFVYNLRQVNLHNSLLQLGTKSFESGLWEYSDLSDAQRIKFLHGCKAIKKLPDIRHPKAVFPPGPESANWVDAGLVGPVVEQIFCGACWAFAAAGLVESVLRRSNITASVSIQQMIDCSKSDKGCTSGWPKTALDYVKNKGITSEQHYVYQGFNGRCTFNPNSTIGALNETFYLFTNGNETLLKDIVASMGPVSIIMRVEESFYNYKSGVYVEPKCGKEGNHCMLLVGYGTDPVNGDFWFVKNSWGTSWGENGYARIARNKNNTCDIANSATWAT